MSTTEHDTIQALAAHYDRAPEDEERRLVCVLYADPNEMAFEAWIHHMAEHDFDQDAVAACTEHEPTPLPDFSVFDATDDQPTAREDDPRAPERR